ncbi:MAG: glycosyltransferase [Parvularculaceae bacterium]|nr:glycosyltransferase [Parvularculaceae bacterium]
MSDRPTLLFVSPQFLFPMDAGGKIRTANILKRLKGGAFKIRLLMPATHAARDRWSDEIATLADDVRNFTPPSDNLVLRARRAAALLGAMPVSVASDASKAARLALLGELEEPADLVVFDYAHSLAFAPRALNARSCLFAHNVETEILERHAKASAGAMRIVWRREAGKMRRFEMRACERVEAVIAVSDRDAQTFRTKFGAMRAFAVPTGVDPDFYRYSPPSADDPPRLIFTGTLDWRANIDGLSWFMDCVWPQIIRERNDVSFTIIGKNPPPLLVARARSRRLNWRFTGYVEDIRDHANGSVFVIPLKVGGGTRIKAFEAMAMGLPVVSTPLGVEGLPLRPGEHFLQAHEARPFADAVLRLLDAHSLRLEIAAKARSLVEKNFSHENAARAFEKYCLEIIGAAR